MLLGQSVCITAKRFTRLINTPSICSKLWGQAITKAIRKHAVTLGLAEIEAL